MRVRIFSIVFSVGVLFTFGAKAQGKFPIANVCDGRLDGTNRDDYDSELIDVEVLQEFNIGGTGWARTYLSSSQQSLVGIVDPEQRLHVFDIGSGHPTEIAMPQPFTGTFTRGEWSEHEGQPVVTLGSQGFLHHFGVGPQSSYLAQAVGLDVPVYPLGVTDEGVLAGMPKAERVRIMPMPARNKDDEVAPIEIEVPGFLRAAHARFDGRDLFATISRGTVGVIDRRQPGAAPVWQRPLDTDGLESTVTWFKTESGEPALAVIDGSLLTVYLPFNPNFEQKSQALAGTAEARHRVRALTTPLSTSLATFLVAPGTNGSKVFRFENNQLELWIDLPPTISRQLNGLFLASNQRVQLSYTEQLNERRSQLVIAKMKRNMASPPVFKLELHDDERIVDFDMDMIDAPPLRQKIMVRTNQRVLILGPTPRRKR